MTTSRDVLVITRHMSGQISWDYDRAEIIADGVVHAIGVYLGLIGAVTILVIAVNIERIEIVPILVYVIGRRTCPATRSAANAGSRSYWPSAMRASTVTSRPTM